MGLLPTSSWNTVLDLIPIKGDLPLLKNWRPVALLCTDNKLLFTVLSNRLKYFFDLMVHKHQSYCVLDQFIMDNLFLIRDLLDIFKLCSIDVEVISIDQKKAFDGVDHSFLFPTLRAFGLGDVFVFFFCCTVMLEGGRFDELSSEGPKGKKTGMTYFWTVIFIGH